MKAGVLGVLALVLVAMPAAAHHPGHNLDKVMGSREKYFQSIDKQTPVFSLRDADGRVVTLSDFKGKVVVLNFIYASCPDVCPLHAERIAEVQALINVSPMKRQVQFVSITTDPSNDAPEILRGYAPAHALDPANWMFLTTTAGQPEDTTRERGVWAQLHEGAGRLSGARCRHARDRQAGPLASELPWASLRARQPGPLRQWARERKPPTVGNVDRAMVAEASRVVLNGTGTGASGCPVAPDRTVA